MFATSKSSFAHSAFSIKIATINLFNFMAPPGAFYDFENIYTDVEWEKKKAWINRYLGSYQPDVVGFQEVFSPDELKKLVEPLGYSYFAVIDQPEHSDEYIYRSPVVALASKFPLTGAKTVEVNATLSKSLGLADDFEFSRQPLVATIELPALGQTDCYVVHLKSKRPLQEEVSANPEMPLSEAITGEISGYWAAAIQRGSEATQLMASIITQREIEKRPVILMGDFNDSLSCEVLAALRAGGLRRITNDMADEPLAHYQLYDSWDLYVKNGDDGAPERPVTHYFGARGNILDYILLSNEFDSADQTSLAEVSDFHCEDRHLVNPQYDQDSHSSDHAIVSITLTLRR